MNNQELIEMEKEKLNKALNEKKINFNDLVKENTKVNDINENNLFNDQINESKQIELFNSNKDVISLNNKYFSINLKNKINSLSSKNINNSNKKFIKINKYHYSLLLDDKTIIIGSLSKLKQKINHKKIESDVIINEYDLVEYNELSILLITYNSSIKLIAFDLDNNQYYLRLDIKENDKIINIYTIDNFIFYTSGEYLCKICYEFDKEFLEINKKNDIVYTYKKINKINDKLVQVVKSENYDLLYILYERENIKNNIYTLNINGFLLHNCDDLYDERITNIVSLKNKLTEEKNLYLLKDYFICMTEKLKFLLYETSQIKNEKFVLLKQYDLLNQLNMPIFEKSYYSRNNEMFINLESDMIIIYNYILNDIFLLKLDNSYNLENISLFESYQIYKLNTQNYYIYPIFFKDSEFNNNFTINDMDNSYNNNIVLLTYDILNYLNFYNINILQNKMTNKKEIKKEEPKKIIENLDLSDKKIFIELIEKYFNKVIENFEIPEENENLISIVESKTFKSKIIEYKIKLKENIKNSIIDNIKEDFDTKFHPIINNFITKYLVTFNKILDNGIQYMVKNKKRNKSKLDFIKKSATTVTSELKEIANQIILFKKNVQKRNLEKNIIDEDTNTLINEKLNSIIYNNNIIKAKYLDWKFKIINLENKLK